MAKESKHRKDERKKPQLTLKEKRLRKQEKRKQRFEHNIDEVVQPEI